jgi:hypothetical protein
MDPTGKFTVSIGVGGSVTFGGSDIGDGISGITVGATSGTPAGGGPSSAQATNVSGSSGPPGTADSSSAPTGNGGTAPGYTGETGGTISGTLFGWGFTIQIGWAWDTSGNSGVLITYGSGRGLGQAFSGGAFAQVSNGLIGDQLGGFAQVSGSVGIVGADVFSGVSSNGSVTGVGFSAGIGEGVGASVMGTNTFAW